MKEVIMDYLPQFFIRVADKFDFRTLATMMLARSKSRRRNSRAMPHAA
jgi:hypothetical protein